MKEHTMADTLAEVRAVAYENRPYWRVMLDPDAPEFIVICAQPIDEYDYDQQRFLTGPIYDEDDAKARAEVANAIMPPHLRTLKTLRVIRRAYGLDNGSGLP